jgi:hypothetical protein
VANKNRTPFYVVQLWLEPDLHRPDVAVFGEIAYLNGTLYGTPIFFITNTIGYIVRKLLQIRGHRFDSGTRLQAF